MATVHDVAAYILERVGALTAMKLQKLVYYSQAWSLARRGIPLFPEEIQAWAHGPVVYELFHLHRGKFVVSEWPWGDSSRMSTSERDFVASIASCYGGLSAAQLSAMTHAEKPWLLARAGTPSGQRASAVISLESMRIFYSEHPLA